MNEDELKVLKEKVIDGIKLLEFCRKEDVERGGVSVHLICTKRDLVLMLDMIEREEHKDVAKGNKTIIIPVSFGNSSVKNSKEVTVISIEDVKELEGSKRFVLWEKDASDHALRYMGRLEELWAESETGNDTDDGK